MRVLFSSLGSYGHTLPLIPLARACVDAGHDVTVATTDAMHAAITSAGLRAVPVGISIRDAFAQLGLADVAPAERARIPDIASSVQRAFGEILPAAYRADLLDVIDRDRPDLVVAEAGNFGAVQAAEEAGIRCVRHGIGRGIPFGHVAADLVHLDVYPPSMQDHEILDLPLYLPLRPVSATGDGPLPRIVDDGPALPLVYVTLGTEFGSTAVLDTIVRALDTGDRRVLVAAGPTVDAEALTGYSDLVEVASWVPQAAVVARSALVVHHGGAGTTLGACAAGVPQLVVPQGADQFMNADAVVARGVGGQLLPDDVSGLTISDAAERLLVTRSAVRDACAQVAAEIAAMPSPADVAADLPGLLATVG
jgi:UDP:flavonoid glycosyltransferase YjiC (YdhE family)